MQNNALELEAITVEPQVKATHTIIWLHGLGADGSDFVPIIPELKLADQLAIRFIFPHAPTRPVTINNGYHMRAWYDIISLTREAPPDETGIAESRLLVEKLIQAEEARGILTSNIILAGFSQGAAMALSVGLQYQKQLGGVIALSGYLPLAEHTLNNASSANRKLPIFLGHGTNDAVVAYAFGKATYALLKDHQYPVAWHSYPIQHTVSVEEIEDIRQWLQEIWR